MKKVLTNFLVLSLVMSIIFGYLMALSPISPQIWRPDPFQDLKGAYSINSRLDAAQKIVINVDLPPGHEPSIAASAMSNLGVGPEDIAVDKAGFLYTGLSSGDILKIDPTTKNAMAVVYNTGGRPLGMRFDHTGQLVIADAIKGLIRVDLQTSNHEVLADSYNGHKLLFVDHLDIADNGDIYFSDASSRFSIEHYLLDFIEASKTGRVFRWRASDRTLSLIADNLYFANGVALSKNNDFLLINETGRSRILKVNLDAERPSSPEVFIDRLPGMPDNIFRDEYDVYWVGMVAKRNQQLESLADNIVVRKILGNFPSLAKKLSPKYGMIIGIDSEGEVVVNLQGQYIVGVTSARPVQNTLFLGFLDEQFLAALPLPIKKP